MEALRRLLATAGLIVAFIKRAAAFVVVTLAYYANGMNMGLRLLLDSRISANNRTGINDLWDSGLYINLGIPDAFNEKYPCRKIQYSQKLWHGQLCDADRSVGNSNNSTHAIWPKGLDSRKGDSWST